MSAALAEPSTRGLILPSAHGTVFGFLYTILDRPWGGLWLWLIVINLISLFTYGLDKLKAVRSEKHPDVRRIREQTLLLLAVLGGSGGALLGMKLFRHKTDQKRFTIGVPLILLAQLLIPFLLYLNSIGYFSTTMIL